MGTPRVPAWLHDDPLPYRAIAVVDGPRQLAAARDRALLLLGYAGAFDRSELVALDVEDMRFSAAGLYVWIAAAKNAPGRSAVSL